MTFRRASLRIVVTLLFAFFCADRAEAACTTVAPSAASLGSATSFVVRTAALR